MSDLPSFCLTNDGAGDYLVSIFFGRADIALQ
ncbi:hypothetical protein BCO71171_03024 [Burkholderia contaminans]|uniref:Uncharacterized protein n=1 Tax=Burkholderia contaminans TaxID=488447 RepID=A0A6P2YGD2_9BURK|nr:hypothetical protein BCO71171_03024 [Burkholderia contaminans]